MTITRRKLRQLRPTARAVAQICNDLERSTRRLRRLLEIIGTQEAQVVRYLAHLDQLKTKYLDQQPPGG